MASGNQAVGGSAPGRRAVAARLRLAGTRPQPVRQQLDAAERELAALRAQHGALCETIAAQTQAMQQLTARLETGLEDFYAALATVQEQHPDLKRQVEYRKLIPRLRRAIEAHVPAGATVAVVNKGDAAMLEMTGRTGWHFPQTLDGAYVGYNPASGLAAVAQLESVRAKGADYLVLPAPALWWLEHYEAFRHQLEGRYRRAMSDPATGAIYALREAAAGPEPWVAALEAAVARCRDVAGTEPAILDWGTGLEPAAALPQQAVLAPPAAGAALPYLDRSIDVVALPAGDAERLAEARRVARMAVVTAGADRSLSVEWLEGGGATAAESCSIVIPTFNAAAHLERCLRALGETLPAHLRVEVVVVDDASGDETPELLERWGALEPRLRVVRNPANAGFIRSCNRGAAAATGQMLVFLNNDTLPLPGWLPPLLATFRDRADAGAVGGKLIYPDGRLQEAGGVIFSDGTGLNFGKFDCDPAAPLYSYVREVDYCSAALLATPRRLFERLGGFDTHYLPAYYEDTDYCFRVAKLGRRVYYQPDSAIVHVEGASCGTSTASGVKRYQEVNRQKFLRRWRQALKRQPAPLPRYDEAALHALAVHRPRRGRSR